MSDLRYGLAPLFESPIEAVIKDPWLVNIGQRNYFGPTAEDAMRSAVYWMSQQGLELPEIFTATNVRRGTKVCEWSRQIENPRSHTLEKAYGQAG